MATVRIIGWNRGFQKISHTKLIQAYTGLGIAEAKRVTDDVLEGQQAEVEVDDRNVEDFLRQVRELGAQAERVTH